jgi:anhydro-N-acetylmuramic acid kinase
MTKKTLRALGLMSGTSLDGIDAAVVETDGEGIVTAGPAVTVSYETTLRERLRRALGARGPVKAVERDMTLAHADVVRALLKEHGLKSGDIDVIGFHGHTILHRPREQLTWQIGDGGLLAARTGIDVVCEFRNADVAEGGEGAPLVPLFHAALAGKLGRPVAVLNIGGVANVTWLGADGDILAFDTGPGNALIDDWMLTHTGRACDENGACAARGRVDRAIVDRFLAHLYFSRTPPKSLDRNEFDPSPVERLSLEDGAATLTAFTAEAAGAAARHFPAPVQRWIVCGGGRRNATLLRAIATATGVAVETAEQVGWDGDALEAQAFAYLAVRSLKGLPLSLPRTTGVARPMPGGQLFRYADGYGLTA